MKHQIDNVFEGAKTRQQIIELLGIGAVHPETFRYILEKAVEFDIRHFPRSTPGQFFSRKHQLTVSYNVPEWHIQKGA